MSNEQNFSIMKTRFVLSGLLLCFILFTAEVCSATAIHFTLNITDNCSPGGYTGSYCAVIYIQSGNNQYCSYRICTLSTGDNNIQYNCELPYYEDRCEYELHVSVCRNTIPPTCCNSVTFYNLCWDDITDGSSTYQITL
jgi:hypothetical protein